MNTYLILGHPIVTAAPLKPDELAAIEAEIKKLTADDREQRLSELAAAAQARLLHAKELKDAGKIITPKTTSDSVRRGKN